MKINRHLNLVVPVERDDGTLIYVHAAPISREAFDQNYLVIAKTFTAIYAQGLNHISGPRIAAKLLREIAKNLDLEVEVQNGLLAEMRRLTNVIAPGPTGWLTLPLDLALSQNLIDPADVEEVENITCFFMLASSMHRRREAQAILEQASKLWGAQLTSSSSTEFVASLRTSTPVADTGPRAAPSSIAS